MYRLRSIPAVLLLSCSLIVMPRPASADNSLPVSILTFPGGHKEDGMWSALEAARDGSVYMGLCTHGGSGQFYVYEPESGSIRHIAAIQDAVREPPGREPQGKLHSQMLEDAEGKIWFGTDMSYPYFLARWDGSRAYPGGHMMVYDPDSGSLDDLGVPFPKASLRVIVMDRERWFIYGIAYPTGRFYTFDMWTGRAEPKGRVCNWDAITRALVLDDDGNVYGSFAPYRIFKYDRSADKLVDLPVRIPHLTGSRCIKPGDARETVWRKPVWHPRQRVIYGMDRGSSTLFRFDPRTNKIEDLGRLAATGYENNRRVLLTTLTLTLAEDGMLYYVALADRGLPCHLIRYDTESGETRDLGAMVDDEKGAAIDLQASVLGPDGSLYFTGWVRLEGEEVANPRSLSGRVMGMVVVKPSVLRRNHGD